MQLSLHPSISDIALRLLLSFLAGALIGFNRESRGHAAGLRTTILICLAATVAMIQANLMVTSGGKTVDSFATMDIMRLPLGILTGVGFIGGGTILKKGDLITGVTTAATIWIATIIGLCFGGGQLTLGITATALCLFTLLCLKLLDRVIAREQRATLLIQAKAPISCPPNLNGLLNPLNCQAYLREGYNDDNSNENLFSFEIMWKQSQNSPLIHDLLQLLAQHYTIESFKLT